MFTKVKTFNVNTKLFNKKEVAQDATNLEGRFRKSRNHKNHVANINFYFDNSKYFIHNCIFLTLSSLHNAFCLHYDA